MRQPTLNPLAALIAGLGETAATAIMVKGARPKAAPKGGRTSLSEACLPCGAVAFADNIQASVKKSFKVR